MLNKIFLDVNKRIKHFTKMYFLIRVKILQEIFLIRFIFPFSKHDK